MADPERKVVEHELGCGWIIELAAIGFFALIIMEAIYG